MTGDLIYSLRMALETGLPSTTKSQVLSRSTDWSVLVLPFTTIEYLNNSPAKVAVNRNYNDTYNFQVGVFARDVGELLRLESSMHDLFRDSEHPLYAFDEVAGAYVDTGETIEFEDLGFTPIENDDSSTRSYDYHGYFDVAVDLL